MKKITTHMIIAILLIASITITVQTTVKADETWDPMIYDSSEVGDPPGNDNGVIDYYETVNAIKDYYSGIINLSQAMDVVALYEGGNVIVDDDADAGWYDSTHVKTIQEGINNASIGNIVFVHNGTYFENVIVDKSVSLVGENKNNTIIDGSGNDAVVFISANNVNLSGFTIQNSGNKDFRHDAGIHITSNHCSIASNNIKNNEYGIYISSSHNNSIFDNKIIDNKGYGLALIYFSNENYIFGNFISSNKWGGIYLHNSSNKNNIKDNIFYYNGLEICSSYNNNVQDNMINDKPLVYLENESDEIVTNAGQVILVNCDNITLKNLNLSDAVLGIQLIDTYNSHITDNYLSNNYFCGILFYECFNNTISGNTILNNGFGIDMTESWNNSIHDNIISSNRWAGIYFWLYCNNNFILDNIISGNDYGIEICLESNHNSIIGNTVLHNDKGIAITGSDVDFDACNNNTIYHNNFMGRITALSDSNLNIWDSGYLSGGNYWADYNGVDSDGDGIGDIPYIISYEGDRDYYPLMEPYGGINLPPLLIYWPSSYNPTIGFVGREYEFNFSAMDPNNDDVFYYVDWGDGTNSSWIGPYNSNEEIICLHNWSSAGTYEVKVKTKDVLDAESTWCAFFVKISELDDPESKLDISIKKGFRKITATVKNVGNATAENINFTVYVEYGLLGKTKNHISDIFSLSKGELQTVEVDGLRGFGKIKVIAEAKADNADTVNATATGWIIGRFIIVIS